VPDQENVVCLIRSKGKLIGLDRQHPAAAGKHVRCSYC
jgi:hypothetical protein